jgi:hypothetical protein
MTLKVVTSSGDANWYSDLEIQVMKDMIDMDLDPHKDEDIEEFWSKKLDD